MKANSNNEVTADGSIDMEVRAYHEPLAEVWYAPAGLSQCEYLLLGEIHERALASLPEPAQLAQRIPVQPRSAEELVSWIRSCPDELNRAISNDLTGDLGDRVRILEWYPATPGIDFEVCR